MACLRHCRENGLPWPSGLGSPVNYGEAPGWFLSVNKEKEAMFQVTAGHGSAYKGHLSLAILGPKLGLYK